MSAVTDRQASQASITLEHSFPSLGPLSSTTVQELGCEGHHGLQEASRERPRGGRREGDVRLVTRSSQIRSKR